MSDRDYIQVQPNVRLHVRDWGEGKVIVFIPGWPLSHEMFEYQFTQLPKQGFRCVGITMRGFGMSSKPWEGYSYDVFANDIGKVLEKLNLRDVTLAGHSMGGAIALRYMSAHGGKRVSRLALIGAAAPCFTRSRDFPHGFERAAVDGLIRDCSSDRAKLNSDFGKIFFRSEDAVSPELGEWFHDMGMQASPRATAECLALLRDTDLNDDLKKVNRPTAIFHGMLDKICPIALAEAVASGIKGSKLVRFEKSGHGLFFEEKEKLNGELMDFAR
jgi:pimeloyl-ACP methyl ester carboxylesterase